MLLKNLKKLLIFLIFMHTLKSKQTFILLLISLYYFYGISLPQGKAEVTTKDSQQIPPDNKKRTESFVEAGSIFSEELLQILKKEYLRKKLPDEKYQTTITKKKTSGEAEEKDTPSSMSSQLHSNTSVEDGQSQLKEEKGTQTTVVKIEPHQVLIEKDDCSTPAIKEEKNVQEELSIHENSQSTVTEKEASLNGREKDVSQNTSIQEYSGASILGTQSSSLEEHGTQLSITIEERTQTSAGDNEQQKIIPDEKQPSSLPEEKSLIDLQSNTTGTEISQDMKERGSSSTPPELPATTVHEKEVLSAFNTESSKNSEIKSLDNENEQKGIQERKIILDEENDTLSVIPPHVFSTPPVNKGESLVKEENRTQTSAMEDKRLQGISEEKVPPTAMSKSSNTAEGGKSVSLPGNAIEYKKEKQVSEIIKGKEEVKSTWSIWHTNQTLSIILAVAITLIAAKIGGWIANMVKLPEVVGNLIIGMVLGNIYFFTEWNFFDFLKTMPFLKVVSYFGTLLLLLTAGLHTDLKALLRVGATSFLVSIGGIIAPAGLSLVVGYFLLPGATFGANLILAIIICNTSTGLLFATLSELKAINTLEGRVITGATILTEIIVILTFGIVSGIAVRGEVSVLGVLVTVVIAFSFLAIVLISVLKYGESFGNFLTSKFAEGLKISIVVTLSLLFAFISGSIGLHGVIGAFAAGLLLRNVKFKDSDDKEYSNIERIIRPYYMILVPILFVRVGAQVDLKSFLDIHAILLGLAITGAAILGKLFCSVCPIEKGINRLAIGIGMAMKLEGTLILAGISRDIGILDDVVFSSIIMVIVLTSTICPSFLRISLLRKKDIYWKSAHSIVGRKEMEKVTID